MRIDLAWGYLLVAVIVSCSALPQLERNMGHPGEAPLPTPVGTCPEFSYNTVFLSDAYYCGYVEKINFFPIICLHNNRAKFVKSQILSSMLRWCSDSYEMP
jgi:hypothetical protein